MKPIFNALEFDGINSMDHGIYITGESIYDAPERDVESVEIAGRNGNVIIDNGRWKNLEVTYHAGTFGKNQAEFASKIRNFRNLLASRYGYHRLMDTYNPEEYRIGRFKSVEVEAEGRKRAGEFDITFDCKPQRYLTNGEASIAVTNGQSLYNATPYDASPLLAVQGYGTIGFNGYEIEIENAVLGTVNLVNGGSTSNARSFTFSNSSYNTGDTINLKASSIHANFTTEFLAETYTLSDSNTNFRTTASHPSMRRHIYTTSISSLTFTAGTGSSVTNTTSINLISPSGSTHLSITIATTFTYTPNVSEENDRFNVNFSVTYDETLGSGPCILSYGDLTVQSTISILGDPTYIDCDLGDAYMVKDGSYISLNRYLDLGSDLPTLASGQNEFTIDNTITSLEVTPRWWIL